ncbi:MAG: WYL domain-containing protein [Clostridia bacterium]|nr:WYL domain-containing protein [Clostridia bacterium]
MAYSELIKNFSRIRDYMREFYVYGFKYRDEYTKKSARSYDDEKRRMESLLGDHMRFRHTPDGKIVFLSIDSRVTHHNPLYKAWKAKSFTDGDITLHFILMDILGDAKDGIALTDILDRIYETLPGTSRPYDESTVRKKLKEYVSEGIVRAEKRGRTVLYRAEALTDIAPYADILDFFSEVAPCGVVGSFLLDKINVRNDHFAFKHHYITAAIDSEILCSLLEAVGDRRYTVLKTVSRRRERISESRVIPLRIMISVQSGRQYLMAYVPVFRRITSFRIDSIISVRDDGPCECFDVFREKLDGIRNHIWGVSTQGRSGDLIEHVEFTIRYGDDEKHIPKRLEREKRCGTVEHIDGNTSRFSADVYDAEELVPWIRSFICRITGIRFSDERLQKQFEGDLEAMYAMYGIGEGGEADAVQ